MSDTVEHEASNEELLTSSRRDPEAFAAFYRRNVGAVVRFAAKRSASVEELHDLVAAIWLEAVASIDRYDERKGTASGWLLGIAGHLCASDARRKAAETAALRRLAGQRVLVDEDYERLESELVAAAVSANIVQAISGLAPAEREVAELTIVEGLSASEAAAALGITPPALRMRLARARRKLRRAVPAAEAAWIEEVV
jgi:RNA polymerase sigma factor (sigma-70 family)